MPSDYVTQFHPTDLPLCSVPTTLLHSVFERQPLRLNWHFLVQSTDDTAMIYKIKEREALFKNLNQRPRKEKQMCQILDLSLPCPWKLFSEKHLNLQSLKQMYTGKVYVTKWSFLQVQNDLLYA